MADESIGDLMELREMREGCCFYLLRGQAGFREIRRTFTKQRIDAIFFHLQMKQKSIGLSAIAEGLEGGDVGAGQGHTVFGEVKHFAVPFEDFK